MRAALTILGLLLLTSCSTIPEKYWEINRETSYKFTYISDYRKHGVPHYEEPFVTGNTLFSGDCEEYAAAVQYQLALNSVPATRWYVIGRAGAHALTCTQDGWCLDAYTLPFRREKAPYVFITTLD